MSLLAALKVMLGVDTVEFQQKMRAASVETGLFENSFGKRTSLVERHGLRLVNSANMVASSFGGVTTSSTALNTALELLQTMGFGRLGIIVTALIATYKVGSAATKELTREMMTAQNPLKTLASIYAENAESAARAAGQAAHLAVQLGASSETVTRLGARNVAVAHAVQLMGQGFGLTAEQARRLTPELAEQARELAVLEEWLLKEAAARRKSAQDFIAAHTDEQKSAEATADALQKELEARDQLGQAGLQDIANRKVAAGALAEENRLLRESLDHLDAERESWARFNLEHGKFIPGSVQVQAALSAGIQKFKEFAEATRAQLHIFNAADVAKQAAALVDQVRAIAQTGGSATQTVAALGTQFADTVKVAKELGVALPPQFQAAAEAIAKGPGLAMDDLFAQFRALPKETEASRAAARGDLEKMGEDLEGSISGGFGRGVTKGISAGQQALDAWRTDLEVRGITVRLTLDTADAQRQLDALRSGRIPATGGAV